MFLQSPEFFVGRTKSRCSYTPQELSVQEEERKFQGERLDEANVSIYTGISKAFLSRIMNVDLDGSFGTKIDTLARHIKWIRQEEPGAKCVVFSQYKDFLNILGTAFVHFRIGFTSLDKRGGVERFQRDANVCVSGSSDVHSNG